MTEKIEVRPGQVWADNDPRALGRTLRVDGVKFSPRMGCDVAVCTVLTNSVAHQARIDHPKSWDRPVDRRGTRTEIAVRRMRPTSSGYRLMRDAAAGSSGEEPRDPASRE